MLEVSESHTSSYSTISNQNSFSQIPESQNSDTKPIKNENIKKQKENLNKLSNCQKTSKLFAKHKKVTYFFIALFIIVLALSLLTGIGGVIFGVSLLCWGLSTQIALVASAVAGGVSLIAIGVLSFGVHKGEKLLQYLKQKNRNETPSTTEVCIGPSRVSKYLKRTDSDNSSSYQIESYSNKTSDSSDLIIIENKHKKLKISFSDTKENSMVKNTQSTDLGKKLSSVDTTVGTMDVSFISNSSNETEN